MKVSISWLKQLVNLKISIEKLIELLPLRTIGIKEITPDFIELDMKGYNRADLLSMRGVALEVAAITDSPVKFTDEEIDVDKISRSSKNVTVDVKDEKLCPVYSVAKIEGLRVGPSSHDVVKKLADSGVRSINNLADITNLIMLEFGQPMHAFDASYVDSETIIVRSAKPGEKITTLDQKERALQTDLLITDPKKVLGIAGVMGGKDSEVSDATVSILLEAAIFNPTSIRKTATRLGLPSEASKRFQHGLTKKRLLQALDIAIKEYQAIGGKLTAITLIGDFADKPKVINLSAEKVRSLMGVNIKNEEIEDYLEKLYFKLEEVEKGWRVTVPYWRLDIELEEDLVEEIARLYGFEKIPAERVSEEKPLQVEKPIFKLISDLKNKLAEIGFMEVQTYSFYSTQVLENFAWDKNQLIKIANPISAETQYLREDLWPNLLEVIAKNSRQGYSDMAIFEIGKVYGPGENGQTTESYRLSLALYNNSDNPIRELYQIFQSLALNLPGWKVNHESKMGEYEQKYFHPTRFAFLESYGPERSRRGGIAEIHKRYTDNFGIKNRVAVLELELEDINELQQ